MNDQWDLAIVGALATTNSPQKQRLAHVACAKLLLNHEKTCLLPARYCSNYGELLLLLSHFSSISLNNLYKKWVSERKLSKSQPE